MTDRELMQQALDVLEDIFGKNKVDVGIITALRERLAQPQRTHWEGCEEVHPECQKTRLATRDEKIVNPGVYEAQPETVMAEYKSQTYAAYKTPDGEMKIGVVPEQPEQWEQLYPDIGNPFKKDKT